MSLFQQQITFLRLDDTLLQTEMADETTDNEYNAGIALLEVSMTLDQWLRLARAGSLEYINMIG